MDIIHTAERSSSGWRWVALRSAVFRARKDSWSGTPTSAKSHRHPAYLERGLRDDTRGSARENLEVVLRATIIDLILGLRQ